MFSISKKKNVLTFFVLQCSYIHNAHRTYFIYRVVRKKFINYILFYYYAFLNYKRFFRSLHIFSHTHTHTAKLFVGGVLQRVYSLHKFCHPRNAKIIFCTQAKYNLFKYVPRVHARARVWTTIGF